MASKHMPMPGRFLVLLILVGFPLGCSNYDASPITPEVITSTITGISINSATCGGTIVSGGNTKLSAYGIAYSSTNSSPTVNDRYATAQSSQATFRCLLSDLIPGTTYYVRAYATNQAGTGYGATMSFTTTTPFLYNVTINGNVYIDSVVEAKYSYSEGDGSTLPPVTYTWYRAVDALGTGHAVIDGATGNRYTVTQPDEFKYLSVGIKIGPGANFPNETEVRSVYVGPVLESPEQVTFTYNGLQVTYEVLISTTTGRKWLDRNLGAQRPAISADDYLAYGDLFQWGRAADGHQLVEWNSANLGSPVNGHLKGTSDSDQVAHQLFIIPPWTDWRSPANNALWQPQGNINNPCPPGWRIPTRVEWAAENIKTSDDGFKQLRLTTAGQRRISDGSLTTNDATRLIGSYWTSTVSIDTLVNAYTFYPATVDAPSWNPFARRGNGYSCRCIGN